MAKSNPNVKAVTPVEEVKPVVLDVVVPKADEAIVDGQDLSWDQLMRLRSESEAKAVVGNPALAPVLNPPSPVVENENGAFSTTVETDEEGKPVTPAAPAAPVAAAAAPAPAPAAPAAGDAAVTTF